MVYNRRYQRRVPTNRQLDKKIRKLENEDELKFKDTSFLVGEVDADSNKVYPIGLVGQGTDSRARIGDFIKGTSLKCRFYMTVKPNSTDMATAMIRVIIFYDSQPSGELPLVVDTNITNSVSLLDISSAAEPILMQYNYSTMMNKYKVLHDQVITLNSTATSGTEGIFVPAWKTKYWKKTIKLNRKTIYSGDDAVIEDLQSNGLFICFLYQPIGNLEADEDTLAIIGNIRMYYKDT